MSDWVGPRKHFAGCYQCGKQRNMTEVGRVDFKDVTAFGMERMVVLVQCDVCEQPGLYTSDETSNWEETFRLFPAPSRITTEGVPTPIRREYQEARSCFEANAYTACVVMVRRTLEGICAEKGAKGRSLHLQLRQLNETGHLDQRLYEWASSLRSLGNDGAHFTGRPVEQEDARDALMLCEALLENIFVLEAQFAQFKERRDHKAVEAAGSALAEEDGLAG